MNLRLAVLFGTSMCLAASSRDAFAFGQTEPSTPGCPDVPAGSCSVCGDGLCVSNPTAVVDFGDGNPTDCGSLQTLGFAGGIPADFCPLLPDVLPQCGCGTTGAGDGLVPEAEIPCEFGPDALTNFYDKDIPRICIDVPFNGGTVSRCYYAYVPDSCGADDLTVPLVVDIHGYTSCPLRSSTYTGWKQKAEEECFVLVWPSGEPIEDSGVSTSCFNTPGNARDVTFGQPGGNNVTTVSCCCLDLEGQSLREGGPDDPLFVKLVIDDALEKFATKDHGVDAVMLSGLSIDEDSVYLVGHSNGCITGLAVAALYPEDVAKVACHSGFLAAPFPPEYSNTPVPIWLVHGVEDLVIPYEGASTDVPPFGEFGYWSLPEATEYLAIQNGCASSSVIDVFDEEGTLVGTKISKTDCVDDATVELVSLTESGHLTFKVPYPEIPAFGGKPTTVDTTNLAWEFLNSVTVSPTASPTGVPTKEGAVCLKILLTNDDGYETLFVNTLFEYLRDRTCHDVVMVAPKGGQSGKGTSIDLFVPGLEDGNPSDGIYFLDSTPITTVYFALDIVCKEIGFEPDLIVSGPNEGWNIGLAGISSGTIAAAQGAMVRGNPAIAVSASVFETETANPLAASRVTELTVKFIEEYLIDENSGELIIGPGQGFNVNIPNVFDVLAQPVPALATDSLDDYEFKLTKIGLATPIGAPRYYRDLADSPLAVLAAGGLFNGQPGLSAEPLYFADGLYPIDEDPDSEGNAIGQVATPELLPLPTFVVTVSPIEFTLQTPPTSKMEKAFKKGKNKNSKKSKEPKKTPKSKK